MTIDIDQLREAKDAVIEALEFYSQGEHMQWVGCHCHGGTQDVDDGEKADAALDKFRDVEEQLEELEQLLVVKG
jgi:diaminopimelate decarboxylase